MCTGFFADSERSELWKGYLLEQDKAIIFHFISYGQVSKGGQIQGASSVTQIHHDTQTTTIFKILQQLS